MGRERWQPLPSPSNRCSSCCSSKTNRAKMARRSYVRSKPNSRSLACWTKVRDPAFVSPTFHQPTTFSPRRVSGQVGRVLGQWRPNRAGAARRQDEGARFIMLRARARARALQLNVECSWCIQGCLWGMYIGDALSMPVHWSYDVSAMKRTYGRIKDYMYAFLFASQPTNLPLG